LGTTILDVVEVLWEYKVYDSTWANIIIEAEYPIILNINTIGFQ
jgi:hypothetical protein